VVKTSLPIIVGEALKVVIMLKQFDQIGHFSYRFSNSFTLELVRISMMLNRFESQYVEDESETLMFRI
jgi:hypothetical protein